MFDEIWVYKKRGYDDSPLRGQVSMKDMSRLSKWMEIKDQKIV